MTWWYPHIFEQKQPCLEVRVALIKAIRSYFDEAGFLEVQTPALQVMPGAEVHVHAFETELRSYDLQKTQKRYLHTSPELAMKKLLVAGLPRIYQLCPVYRNAEGSSLHAPEFTMLEWYRTEAAYEHIMADIVSLLRAVAGALNIDVYRHQDSSADPFASWQKITVAQAFKDYAALDLERDWLPQLDEMGTEDWDARFFKVFMEKIEPHLGQGVPTILYDYPAHMAALSKVKTSDPRYAERFEVYICGMELANAFTELTDAMTQQNRFEADMLEKQQIYGSTWPVDDDFIAALTHGMPPAGGIALGVDRLVMLATGAEHIDQVMFCS